MKIIFNIDEETKKKLKILAIERGVSMTDIIIELIKKELKDESK